MNESRWLLAYQSDLQAVYSLLVVPLAFLAYRVIVRPDPRRGVVPDAAGFVSILTLLVAIETMIDPIATGPLLKSAALHDTIATSIIPFVFVYLGDLRVLLLLAVVAQPAKSWRGALRWSVPVALVVPILAGSVYAAVSILVDGVTQKLLWMIYEAGFLMLCVTLARKWVPNVTGGPDQDAKRAFLLSVLGYSAAYYSLWLSADFVITLGGLDLGWALRMVPNQLYYAFWVPFVYVRFFSRD